MSIDCYQFNEVFAGVHLDFLAAVSARKVRLAQNKNWTRLGMRKGILAASMPCGCLPFGEWL